MEHSLGSSEIENPFMQRRKHVKSIRLDQSCRLRADSRDELRTGACERITGLDQPRVSDGHMDQPTLRIEEGRIRYACKGPFAPHLSRLGVNFDKQSAVACHV